MEAFYPKKKQNTQKNKNKKDRFFFLMNQEKITSVQQFAKVNMS